MVLLHVYWFGYRIAVILLEIDRMLAAAPARPTSLPLVETFAINLVVE